MGRAGGSELRKFTYCDGEYVKHVTTKRLKKFQALAFGLDCVHLITLNQFEANTCKHRHAVHAKTIKASVIAE